MQPLCRDRLEPSDAGAADGTWTWSWTSGVEESSVEGHTG